MLRTLLLLLTASAAMAADYHVSPSGDDAADGTSPKRAWKSVARAVRHCAEAGLRPGDRLLFAGGVEHVLDQPLQVPPGVRGAPGRPVTIASYGAGRATLLANGTTAISIYRAAGDGGALHLRIADLNLRGDGVARPGPKPCAGIQLWTEASAPVDGLLCEDLEISGFAGDGIVTSRKLGAPRVRGIVVRRVVCRDNPGAAGVGPNTGSGILLGGVEGALVEDCVAVRNGERNDNPGGPVGIWYWDAIDSVIRRCAAADNRSRHGDGGGFDLDGGSQRCVIERCISSGNVGAGYLFAQFAGAHEYGPLADCVIRYCLSIDDGRKDNFGAIHVWGNGGPDIVGANLIHNLTVIVTGAATSGTPSCVRFQGGAVRGLVLRDNLFIAGDGNRLLDAPADLARDAAEFRGNHWYALDGRPVFRFGTNEIATLADWPAGGIAQHDRLGDPGWRPPTPSPSFLPGFDWAALKAFAPARGSPLADGGAGGVEAGTLDLLGTPVTAGARWVGALAPR